MSEADDGIARIRALAQRIVKLTDDPQPGLFTWASALLNSVESMTIEIWPRTKFGDVLRKWEEEDRP